MAAPSLSLSLPLSLSEYELNPSCHGHFLDVNYFPFLLIIIYLHIIKAVHMHVVHNGYTVCYITYIWHVLIGR